ncbi:hypothetical protein [Hoeflea sp.]|nr:hypothetical protein [Hoeflea sp.]MBC7283546.1 hypothetical protein [Hoeflea sp.]
MTILLWAANAALTKQAAACLQQRLTLIVVHWHLQEFRKFFSGGLR